MAKISHANGPTFSEEELQGEQPVVVTRPGPGGESQSVGNNSQELSQKQKNGSQLSGTDPQPLAQTTENPSDQTDAEDTDALSTGTDGPGMENSESTSDEEDYSAWNVEDLKAELAARELPVSGKKAELIARLEEDDADGTDDQSEEDDSE